MKTKTALLWTALALAFCSRAFGADSHTLPIALEVTCQDSVQLHDVVEGLIAGELRRLGTVRVVNTDGSYVMALRVIIITDVTVRDVRDVPAGYSLSSTLTSSLEMEHAILQEK